MKKVALTVAVLALGLAACETKTENAVENTTVENAVEADAMAADSPDRYVSTITKSKRGGKILIDYLRNQRGQTAVAAYSSRARPGAAVSAPLTWDELQPGIGPGHFTVENMPTRLEGLASDPWDGFKAAAVPLQASRSGKGKKAG